MKYLYLLILSFQIYANTCDHNKTSFKCVKYLKNYDGDTITFNIPNTHPLIGEKISIRVNGVDTPEIKTKNKCEKEKGRNAKRFVKAVVSRAKRIDLENVKRGKYFRIVADVMVDGANLRDLLIKNKLAYPYHGKTKRKIDWCKF